MRGICYGLLGGVLAALTLGTPASANASETEEEAPEHKVLTGSVDAGIFADRQNDQDVATVSPLLQMGIRARPEVELGFKLGAAMLFADSRVDGEVRAVRPSNLTLGTAWVRDHYKLAHRGHIGFAFALPTNFGTTDRENEALEYAVAVRGGLDPWQWAPATLGIVVPGGWSWRGEWVQVGADGALGALVAAASNPDRPGFAAQLRAHVAFASKWAILGAAASGAVNTRHRTNKTQVAVGPFFDVPLCFGKKRRPTCPLSIVARVNVNLDAPYGFAKDGLRVWGSQLGLRWSVYEST